MKYNKAEAKEWAKENYKGLQSVILPSFTAPDLAELDEEGIRYDVQYLKKQGFFSILCAPECCGMTPEERRKYVEIVCDEAKGKILVSLSLLLDSFSETIEMLKHAEKVGCHSVLFCYPLAYYPKSEEDIYQLTKVMCDSINLAVDIYPSPKFNFEKFHPSTFNPKLLVRMADIPNVVALKIGIGNAAFVAECFRLVGHKILVNSPLDTWWPITIPQYGQQWAGCVDYDAYQSPNDQRCVKMFNLFVKGETDKAMEIYWELAPIRNAWLQLESTFTASGLYNFTIMKYWQWMRGGNGGLLREPVVRLYEHDKAIAKAAIKATGGTVREPDEEFYVGRLNYAKGIRARIRP